MSCNFRCAFRAKIAYDGFHILIVRGPNMNATVKLATARELACAGSVRQATLRGQQGGYAIVLRVGMVNKTLATKAGVPRLFAQLDRAARLLRDDLGLGRFEVDATGYAPGNVTRRRPDRTEVLRQQKTVLEHDRWFRGEVLEAQREADDPATAWVSNEQAKHESAKWRRDTLARVQNNTEKAAN